jgi:hypothetical protein
MSIQHREDSIRDMKLERLGVMEAPPDIVWNYHSIKGESAQEKNPSLMPTA